MPDTAPVAQGWRQRIARLPGWSLVAFFAGSVIYGLDWWGKLDAAKSLWTTISPALKSLFSYLATWSALAIVEVSLTIAGLAGIMLGLFGPAKPWRLSRKDLRAELDSERGRVKWLEGELATAKQTIRELTPPEKTHFLYLGVCWELTSYFFQQFREVLAPTDYSSFIRGPFCPRCGAGLLRRANYQSVGAGGQPINTPFQLISVQCECGWRGPDELGLPISTVLTRVYNEAQRLARNNLPFPLGPCANPPHASDP